MTRINVEVFYLNPRREGAPDIRDYTGIASCEVVGPFLVLKGHDGNQEWHRVSDVTKVNITVTPAKDGE